MIYYSEKKLSRIQNTNQVLDSNTQSPNPQTHQRIVENQQYENQQRIRNMQINQHPQNPGNQQVFAENRNIPNQPTAYNPQYPMGIPPTYPQNPTPVLSQITQNSRTAQPQYVSQDVRSSAIGMNVHQTYPVVSAQALNEEEKLPNIHNRTVSMDNPMNSTNIGLHLLANQYIDQEERKAPAGSPQQLNNVQANSGNPELNQMSGNPGVTPESPLDCKRTDRRSEIMSHFERMAVTDGHGNKFYIIGEEYMELIPRR